MGEILEKTRLFGFDPHGEPTVLRTSDGILLLVIELVPPSWAMGKLPGDCNDLAKKLTRALGVPVDREDRERFAIRTPPDDAAETIERALHEYRRHYDKSRFARGPIAPDLTKPIRSYSQSNRFSVGERVDHASFGIGTVQESETDSIRLFFPDGETHRFAQRDVTYDSLERVFHTKFGYGHVVATVDSTKVNVRFGDGKERTLLADRLDRDLEDSQA